MNGKIAISGPYITMKEAEFDARVVRFLLDEVDTVPQIEALLLLWENRPRQWAVDELAHRLYVAADAVPGLLAPLARRGLIVARSSPALYSYESRGQEADRVIEAVANAYRRDLVRATTIIHNKASAGIREFARAFKFTKDST